MDGRLGGRIDADDRDRRRQRPGPRRPVPRYVRRSNDGAATSTPGVPSIVASVAADRPASPNAATRRSARPTSVATARSTAASMPAFVARPAYRTATPRATPDRRERRAQRAGPKAAPREAVEAAHAGQRPSRASRAMRTVASWLGAPTELDRVEDPAVTDDEDAVGVGSGLRVVGHEDDRLVALLA